MATKADIYKSAVDFAHETLALKDAKELMRKALERFESLRWNNADWEFWIGYVNNQRNQMDALSKGKMLPMQPEAPQVDPSHVTGGA